MMHSYSNDELIKLMDAAPLPVQQAIESKATAAVVVDLGTRLRLHVDIIGKIATLNVQMLLGLVNSQEFLQELIAAGVSEKDAREIIAEINQKIFVPLRAKMRNGEIATPSLEPAKPATLPMPPRHLINKIQIPENKTPHPIVGEKLLEDHEEPSPSLKATEGTAHTELGKMPLAPPRPIAPPPNLSGAMPTAAPPPSRPVARSYTADPYREPIDEGQV